jgi:hypothetical protein
MKLRSVAFSVLNKYHSALQIDKLNYVSINYGPYVKGQISANKYLPSVGVRCFSRIVPGPSVQALCPNKALEAERKTNIKII